MNLELIPEGATGQEAAEIIFKNDTELRLRAESNLYFLKNSVNEYMPVVIGDDFIEWGAMRIFAPNGDRSEAAARIFNLATPLPTFAYILATGVFGPAGGALTYEIVIGEYWTVEQALPIDQFIVAYYEAGYWGSKYPSIAIAIANADKVRQLPIWQVLGGDQSITISDTEITIPFVRLITSRTWYETSARRTLTLPDAGGNYMLLAKITGATGTPASITLSVVSGNIFGEGNLNTLPAYTYLLAHKKTGTKWQSDYAPIQGALTSSLLENGETTSTVLGLTGNSIMAFAAPYIGGIGYNSNTQAVKDGRIKRITVGTTKAGAIQLFIGLIDQYNRVVIDRALNFNAPAAGFHDFDVDEPITQGNALFSAIDTVVGYSNNSGGPGTNRFFYNPTDRFGALSPYLGENGGFIQLKYTLEYVSANINDLQAKSTALSEENKKLKSDLAYVSNNPYTIDTVTGGRVKIIVSNGELGVRPVLVKNVVAFGNSITRHPITSFWWGEWGMAATERSKDWVHQLQAILRSADPAAQVLAYNTSVWELQATAGGFDYSYFDQYLTGDVDTILIKLGENGILDGYGAAFTELLNYLQNKKPFAQIVIGGLYFGILDKEPIMKAAAAARNIPFVDISYMWGSANYRSTLDTLVYGDDGIWRPISDGGSTAPGVAGHPNDLAMLGIANGFATALGFTI